MDINVKDDRYSILNRMLDRLPDTYDKSEGNPIYDILMSLSIELEEKYIEQYAILDRGFASTASEVYLDYAVEDSGVVRKEATKSTGIVKFIGKEGTLIKDIIVVSDLLEFITIEETTINKSGEALVMVECLTAGSTGNIPKGAIKDIKTSTEGLNSVTNLNQFENGFDTESDNELRDRFHEKVRTPATSGNEAHYKIWAKEVIGVGDAKTRELWNGNNTVKVIIVNSNKRSADEGLINKTQNYIMSKRTVGAKPTVVSASELILNVSATIVIDSRNYTLDDVITNFKNTLNNYLYSISFKVDYISIAKIGSLLLSTNGVIDYNSLELNNSTSNIVIDFASIAVLGEVTLNE